MLYGADKRWWEAHNGVKEYAGIKATTYKASRPKEYQETAEKFDLLRIPGIHETSSFGFESPVIHYGNNSGFQAVNIAIHTGLNPIILLGFDMRIIDRKRHWFGDHPTELNIKSNYNSFIKAFHSAAPELAKRGIDVVNCTPGSALTCFRNMALNEALP